MARAGAGDREYRRDPFNFVGLGKGESIVAQIRLWEWGMRQSTRLPTWAQVTFAVFLMWPCVVVARWRLFVGLGILTAGGLWVAQWWYHVDEFSWGVVAGLSTIHIWFPVVVLAPLLLPYTLLMGMLALAVERRRRRREQKVGL